MDSPQIRIEIQAIWERLDVPVVRLEKSPGPGCDPEAMKDVFSGKRFDEVNTNFEAFNGATPLLYFTNEAKIYYLGTYLLHALRSADQYLHGQRWIFLDIPEVHALNTLRDVLMLNSCMLPFTKAEIDYLWALLEYFEGLDNFDNGLVLEHS